MKVIVKIECDNAAFKEDCENEVSRILNNLSSSISHFGLVSKALVDANGNVVGKVVVEGDDAEKTCDYIPDRRRWRGRGPWRGRE